MRLFDMELLEFVDDYARTHYVHVLFDLTKLFGITPSNDECYKSTDYFMNNYDVYKAVDAVTESIDSMDRGMIWSPGTNFITLCSSTTTIFTSYQLDHPEEFDGIYSGELLCDPIRNYLRFINIKEALKGIFKAGWRIEEIKSRVVSYNLICMIEYECELNPQFMSYITELRDDCLEEYKENNNVLYSQTAQLIDLIITGISTGHKFSSIKKDDDEDNDNDKFWDTKVYKT